MLRLDFFLGGEAGLILRFNICKFFIFEQSAAFTKRCPVAGVKGIAANNLGE